MDNEMKKLCVGSDPEMCIKPSFKGTRTINVG